MRILEKTPNKLKIQHERSKDRSWISILALPIIFTISSLCLQESSVTLFCKKNNNKVINCEYQENRIFGLMKMVNFSFEGLKEAKPSPKGSTIFLFTSYGQLTTDLGYNSSYEAVSAEIDNFVKNPKRNSLIIHRDNRLTSYKFALLMLCFYIVLLMLWLVTDLLFNTILSKTYTFDKNRGKAIFSEKKLFRMKAEEYPINEMIALRIAGETSPQSSYYKIHLLMNTGQELLLTDFVLVESKDARKMARNVQETVDTLCSFLNLPDSQKITNFNERIPKLIKNQKSLPTKLVIAEPKKLPNLMLVLVILPILLFGGLVMAQGINIMINSSSTEAILSCDRQKNRCEIKDGYKAEIQNFAASQLKRAQMYMTVDYFAGEVYSLELIVSDRGKEEIFSISIFKHGKSSYQEIEEIVKQVNDFINQQKSPLLKITIWQGNSETNPANKLIFLGGILMLPFGIFFCAAIVRGRQTCTFDKNLGKLLLKTNRFRLAKATEYLLSDIREVRIEQNVGCEVVLVMNSGERFPIIPTYWYLPKYKAEEIAESIRAFLNQKSLREL